MRAPENAPNHHIPIVMLPPGHAGGQAKGMGSGAERLRPKPSPLELEARIEMPCALVRTRGSRSPASGQLAHREASSPRHRAGRRFGWLSRLTLKGYNDRYGFFAGSEVHQAHRPDHAGGGADPRRQDDFCAHMAATTSSSSPDGAHPAICEGNHPLFDARIPGTTTRRPATATSSGGRRGTSRSSLADASISHSAQYTGPAHPGKIAQIAAESRNTQVSRKQLC